MKLFVLSDAVFKALVVLLDVVSLHVVLGKAFDDLVDYLCGLLG